MSPGFVVLILVLSMLLLFLTGRQIAFIMGGIAVSAATLLWGTSGGIDMGYFATYSFLGWYVLIAVPMFIFMGIILARSGVADALYDAIYKWAGPVRGGLAMGTIGICALMAAMVGQSTSATVSMGLIALPSMLKRNYDKRMVTGAIQAGGALGFLIPPSLVFIVYGLIARVSIGHLWVAGIVPGILLAVLYVIYIGTRSYLQPQLGPPIPVEDRASWREKFVALRSALLPLALIFLVLGLLFMGVTSLIEASGVGALGALVLALIKRNLTWKFLADALDETLRVTSFVLLIVVAALLFSAVFDGLGAVHVVRDAVSGVGGKWAVLIAMQLSWIILGMVLDDTAMLIIVAPVYIPLAASYGFDLVWFGVLYVINCQMAYLTPPFGYNLFIMKSVAPKEVTLADIYRSVLPFVGIQFLVLVLVMVFPQIALWLPSVIFAK